MIDLLSYNDLMISGKKKNIQMLDFFIPQNPTDRPGFLLYSWIVEVRRKQTKSSICFLMSPLPLGLIFPLCFLPSPTTGTAWRNNPGQGGRGQRWKQAGAWSHLWDKLPLGRLHKRVRHPGSACACKWLVFRDGASQLGDLCMRSASLTLHGVKFLSWQHWKLERALWFFWE